MNCSFKERTDCQYKWETHFSLTTPGSQWRPVYDWCWTIFGKPGADWDYHGGWIKLRSDEELVMFKLRWP
jgi:hypothetical protein